jgi:hypothetical protein
MHTLNYNRIAFDMFRCQNCFKNAKAKFLTILSWTFVNGVMAIESQESGTLEGISSKPP